jgi:hypothetical protein
VTKCALRRHGTSNPVPSVVGSQIRQASHRADADEHCRIRRWIESKVDLCEIGAVDDDQLRKATRHHDHINLERSGRERSDR